MAEDLLIYLGSIILFFWGIAHAAPTKAVVKGFEPLTDENRLVLIQTWIVEATALIFISALVFAVTFIEGSDKPVSEIVYNLSGGFLLISSGIHFAFGFRTSVIPMKICPVILFTVAVLIIGGNMI